MPIRRRVTCISRRSNYYLAHEKIEHIGGVDDGVPWKVTESIAIKQITYNTHTYYVLIKGRETEVIVSSYGNDLYLKTVLDSYSPDRLLALDDCPI